jgi:S1-C subfamily serine protease
VKPQLTVVTGTPAGTTVVFSHTHITLGRHPDSDVVFDAHEDIEVSVRHAAIVKQGDRWVVRDMDSRNGTLVNGHKITADTPLSDTDQIRLGTSGPLIECRLVADHVADTPRRPSGAARESRPTPLASPAPPAKQSTTHRVRVEVARQTRRLRRISMFLFGTLVAVAAGLLFVNYQQRLVREREVTALQAQIDSVLSDARETVAALEEEMSGLAGTLEASRGEIQALQRNLTEAREAGNAERIETLSAELQDALTILTLQQHAANIDFPSITRANQPAVAMVFADFGGGRVETSTAFAVRSDGTMITTRHSVAGPTGDQRARQIGVRFANSRQTFRARIAAVATGDVADVAIITVELEGEVPTVQGFNLRPDTVPIGAAVAVIGFPGGMDSPQLVRPDGTYATATLTAGTVSKNLPDVIQINGYGVHGASGSPIFDAGGQVVGILSSGEVGSGGRIVYAVPAGFARELLESLR